MAKYSFEFKKNVVLEYINGEGGTQYLSTKYGLGSNSQLRKWLAVMKNVPNAVILLIGVLAVVRAAKKAEEEKFESKRVKRQAEKEKNHYIEKQVRLLKVNGKF